MLSGGFFFLFLSFNYHVMVPCCMLGNHCRLVGIITLTRNGSESHQKRREEGKKCAMLGGETGDKLSFNLKE